MATAPPRVLLGLCDAAVPPGEGLPSQGAASKLGGSPVGRDPLNDNDASPRQSGWDSLRAPGR